MKKILSTLISLFTTAGAFADPFSFTNFYIGGFGGFNSVNSYEENGVRVELNSGYAIAGALGYRYSRFFRFEGEAAYRSNTFDQLVIEDEQFPASGSLRKSTLMVNGIMELPFLENSLIAYFGGGIGERWDREKFTLDPISSGGTLYIFDTLIASSRGIAYQGIMGLTFCVGKKILAGVEYRYLDGSHIQGNHAFGLNIKRYF